MSLLPFVFYDWDDLMYRPLLEQSHLGPELLRRPARRVSSPAESVSLTVIPQRRHELDELRDMLNLVANRRYEAESQPRPPVGKDDFQAVLDVQHFKPEEIEVKVVDDRLVVTAKHEEKRDDHGWVSRQFVRKYRLPKDVDVDVLTTQLSSDGLLTIVAPKKQPLKDETERTLRIVCTGQPFVNKKQEKQAEPEQSNQEQ